MNDVNNRIFKEFTEFLTTLRRVLLKSALPWLMRSR